MARELRSVLRRRTEPAMFERFRRMPASETLRCCRSVRSGAVAPLRTHCHGPMAGVLGYRR
jgi:hypothetical protein